MSNISVEGVLAWDEQCTGPTESADDNINNNISKIIKYYPHYTLPLTSLTQHAGAE